MINNDFLNDIEIDPKFLDRMTEQILNTVEDEIQDYAWQIAGQYVPAPSENDDLDKYEDEVCDRVINPLYDRILDQILSSLKNGE